MDFFNLERDVRVDWKTTDTPDMIQFSLRDRKHLQKDWNVRPAVQFDFDVKKDNAGQLVGEMVS